MLEKGRNKRAGQEECDGVEEQPVTVALYASDSEATCVAPCPIHPSHRGWRFLQPGRRSSDERACMAKSEVADRRRQALRGRDESAHRHEREPDLSVSRV